MYTISIEKLTKSLRGDLDMAKKGKYKREIVGGLILF